MSWGPEFEDERNRENRAKEDRELALHSRDLIKAKGHELWDSLRAKCKELVDAYEAECLAQPGDLRRCKIRFDEATPDVSFYIQKESVSDSPRAFVTLRLSGYEIEVKHVTWRGRNSPPTTELTHLVFESDGILEVWLTSAGSRIEIEEAARRVILRKVLFGEAG